MEIGDKGYLIEVGVKGREDKWLNLRSTNY